MPQLSMHSPLGSLTLSEEDERIVALDWGWGRDQSGTEILRAGIRQLNEYFDGARVAFDLPLHPHGSLFKRRVWNALLTIPFGETRTYGEIASMAETSPRAIGQANRLNPIPVLIPCHRVVGRAGRGGYSGAEGLASKCFLLELEREDAPVHGEERT